MKNLILISIFLVSTGSLFSQSNSKYDYISILQFGHYLYISDVNSDDEKVEVIDVEDQKEKGDVDLRPLYRKVMEYEDQGWEFVSDKIVPDPTRATNYFVLIRRLRD